MFGQRTRGQPEVRQAVFGSVPGCCPAAPVAMLLWRLAPLQQAQGRPAMWCCPQVQARKVRSCVCRDPVCHVQQTGCDVCCACLHARLWFHHCRVRRHHCRIRCLWRTDCPIWVQWQWRLWVTVVRDGQCKHVGVGQLVLERGQRHGVSRRAAGVGRGAWQLQRRHCVHFHGTIK